MERHGRVFLDVLPNGQVEFNEGWSLNAVESLRGYKVFLQEEHGRVLRYNTKGKLVEIEFAPGEVVDLQGLPQDETIPSDAKLVELFNAHNITPQVQEDLIPA
jgi:hypothetical protein